MHIIISTKPIYIYTPLIQTLFITSHCPLGPKSARVLPSSFLLLLRSGHCANIASSRCNIYNAYTTPILALNHFVCVFYVDAFCYTAVAVLCAQSALLSNTNRHTHDCCPFIGLCLVRCNRAIHISFAKMHPFSTHTRSA